MEEASQRRDRSAVDSSGSELIPGEACEASNVDSVAPGTEIQPHQVAFSKPGETQNKRSPGLKRVAICKRPIQRCDLTFPGSKTPTLGWKTKSLRDSYRN
jgi:hypothetical protein